MQVIAALDGADPTTCKSGDKSCIVARRSIGYVSHTKLTLPIELRASCLGVDCPFDQTCVAGACVSATVSDPSKCTGATGCSEGTLPPADAGAPKDASSVALESVSAAGNTTCATRAGAVYCWGDDSTGQLGDGLTAMSAKPIQVNGFSSPIAIGVGTTSACAVLASGTVICWGSNSSGQLGRVTNGVVSTQGAVTGVSNATSVACGSAFCCARQSTGAVTCWGDNGSAQYGNQKTGGSTAADTVAGLSDATAITAGAAFACALKATGAVVCWGSDVGDAMGAGLPHNAGNVPAPAQVSMGGRKATSLASSLYQSCMALDDGSVACFGAYDPATGFGSGARLLQTIPTVVPGVTSATKVTVGDTHACAARSDGTTVCWGSNTNGQLGATGPSFLAPLTAAGVNGARALSAGTMHTCALVASGQLLCWGRGDIGQLGDGSLTQHTAQPVPGWP